MPDARSGEPSASPVDASPVHGAARADASALTELRAGGLTVFCAALGSGLGIAGLLTYNSGLFVNALGQEIGLSRTAYGAVFFGATLAMCFAMPLVALLLDRYGPRLTAVFGAVSLAAGFALLSFVHSVAGYAGAMLFTGLFAASSSPIAHTRAVVAKFRCARGFALGLTQLGIGLAAALIPPFISALLAREGWRAALLALSALALAGILPALGLPRRTVVRSRDRDDPAPAFRELWVLRLFWIQLAAFASMALAFAGMLAHFVPMLVQGGLSIAGAGALAGLIGVSVIATRVLIGWLSDRMNPAWLAMASCAVCAAGCIALALGGTGMAVVGALALGAAIGAEADLIAILTARNFSLAIYGRAYSTQYAAFSIAAGISPLWTGYVADLTGSYRLPLLLCAVLLALPIALFGMLLRREQ